MKKNDKNEGNSMDIYSLTFYDNHFYPIAIKPLSNNTNPSYEVPNYTSFITLDSIHLEEKEKYSSHDIFYFIDISKVQLRYDNKRDFFYITSPASFGAIQINDNYKLFENTEQLKKFTKSLVNYFNDADLTNINTDIEFSKNEKGQIFEKKIIHDIKKNL